MKKLFFLFLLIPFISNGQIKFPFAVSRTTDTAYDKGALLVDGAVRFPLYGVSDTNKVLSVDIKGNLILRTKGTGGVGSESDPIWSGVSSQYRTKTQNDLLYNPLLTGSSTQYVRGDGTFATYNAITNIAYGGGVGGGDLTKTNSSGTALLVNIPTSARTSISLTTTGSGASSYNSSTGVLNIPTPSASGNIPFTSLTNNIWDFSSNGYQAKAIVITTDSVITTSNIGNGNVAYLAVTGNGYIFGVDDSLWLTSSPEDFVTVAKTISTVHYVRPPTWSPYTPITPDAPTSGVTNDINVNSFNFTYTAGYTTLSDNEQTLNGGTTWTPLIAKPIIVGNVIKAAGQVGVRVKSHLPNHYASAPLFDASGFTLDDVTPPTVVSVTATAAHNIRVVYSETVTGTSSGWSFNQAGSLTISGVAGSNSTTLDYTITQAMVGGTSITYAYSSGTGNTADLYSNALASTSGTATNSIPSVTILTNVFDPNPNINTAAITPLHTDMGIGNLWMAFDPYTWIKTAGTIHTIKFKVTNSAGIGQHYVFQIWRHTGSIVYGSQPTTFTKIGEEIISATTYPGTGTLTVTLTTPIVVQVGDMIAMGTDAGSNNLTITQRGEHDNFDLEFRSWGTDGITAPYPTVANGVAIGATQNWYATGYAVQPYYPEVECYQ